MIPHPADERYAGLAWADYTWPDLEAAAEEGRIVLLPLGSIEQHGPMIPVGCDTLIAATRCLEGARRARERFGVRSLTLPPIPYGYAAHHTDFAGTVSLEMELYIRLMKNILREALRPGFRRIVLVTGHGGNLIPAKAATVSLGAELYSEGLRDARLYVVDGANCYHGSGELYASLSQGQFDFHASAWETSMYLQKRPDLVQKERMTRPEPKVDAMPLHANWRTKDITESGASGDPSMATAEAGQRSEDCFSDLLAEFLKRVAEEA